VTESRLDLTSFVRKGQDGVASMVLAVEGVTCAACIDDIEGGLSRLPGLVRARLNVTNRRVTVDWNDGALDPASIVDALGRMGYRAHPFVAGRAEAESDADTRFLLRCVAVAAFASANVMLLAVSVWAGNASDMTPEARQLFNWISALIALPSCLYAGQPFYRNALAALARGRLDMDVPISIGILATLGLSVHETIVNAEHVYFDSVVTLLLFLLAGRFLDHEMRKRTRAAAANLAALKADLAHRLDADGTLTTIPTAALQSGDRILVRAGDRLPADGVLLSERADLDVSFISGETAPATVLAGKPVHAGAINRGAAFEARVTAVGAGTLIDDVERLIERAEGARGGYVGLAERAARVYAPVVHLAALLTAIGWWMAGTPLHDAIVTAVAVLIITCPCALALAIPAVQVAATGELFRRSVLVNDGGLMERLAPVDTVVFDKTGTLTLPEPGDVSLRALDGGGADDLAQIAGRLALTSHHPLARAIAAKATDPRPIPGAVETPGLGVSAEIDGVDLRLGRPDWCGLTEEGGAGSTIGLRVGARIALIEVGQTLRPDAGEVVAALQAKGLAVSILSGDRAEAVAPVADALGVAEWRAGVSPADKIAEIERLKASGRVVLMVGDGLNDAAALAAANASLSPISAADVTQAKADAVFLGDKLGPVASTLAVSRFARTLMAQNLWLSAIYNLIAVPLAVAGFVTPLVAAIAMSASSVIVTVNALRVKGKGA
jgi:Cu2+-exporting ATPase